MSGLYVDRTPTNDHYTIVHKVSHELMNDPAVDMSSLFTRIAATSARDFLHERPTLNVGDTVSITVEVMS